MMMPFSILTAPAGHAPMPHSQCHIQIGDQIKLRPMAFINHNRRHIKRAAPVITSDLFLARGQKGLLHQHASSNFAP